MNITFSGCSFFENHYWKSLIKTDVPNTLSESSAQCAANIFVQGFAFKKNASPILEINGGSCVLNAIIGQSLIHRAHIPQSGKE